MIMSKYPPSTYMFKAMNVLKSCITEDQLLVGDKYMHLAKLAIMDTPYPDDLKDSAIEMIDDFYISMKNIVLEKDNTPPYI